MNLGKSNRLKNILRNGKAVIVPIDHGLTYGPIAGIDEVKGLLAELSQSSLDAIIAQKGVLQKGLFPGKQAQIVHISGSTSLSGKADKKVLVGKVEDALRMGAAAVSVHVSIGSGDEHQMLQDVGMISSECEAWGMPLLAMMYVVNQNGASSSAKTIAHIARIAAELGADLVKVPYTGSAETFEEVVRGCFIPVFTAGGETKAGEAKFLAQVRESLDAGSSGLCVGRNVFQSRNPRAFLSVLEKVVHEDLDAETAFELYCEALIKKTASHKILSNLEVVNEYSN